MSNVLEIKIDTDIQLEESKVVGMPYGLRQHLLATMTIAMEKYDCHWKELAWKIKFNNGQPIIYVRKK